MTPTAKQKTLSVIGSVNSLFGLNFNQPYPEGCGQLTIWGVKMKAKRFPPSCFMITFFIFPISCITLCLGEKPPHHPNSAAAGGTVA